MKEMTPPEAGKFLRNLAELTATNSKNWDNYEAIATEFIAAAYKAGTAFTSATPHKRDGEQA